MKPKLHDPKKATVLIKAKDDENNEIFLFYAMYLLNKEDDSSQVSMDWIREMLGKAFKLWAKTSYGRKFIVSNGGNMNWGDAASIPDEFLRRASLPETPGLHILWYGNLTYLSGKKIKFNIKSYNSESIVRHDEILFRMNK